MVKNNLLIYFLLFYFSNYFLLYKVQNFFQLKHLKTMKIEEEKTKKEKETERGRIISNLFYEVQYVKH